MRKVNLRCGRDYRPGWINVDFNRAVRADVYCTFTEGLPFADDSLDVVALDNVLEHVQRDCYFAFLEDLHRACKPGATIQIYVPRASTSTRNACSSSTTTWDCPALSRLRINGLFNFGGLLWKELMERFQFLGFDEIYFELEVAKST